MTIDVLVIGGGPAGLSAAEEALRLGASVTVLERLGQVGGLCRTIEFDQCRFDIGPHRFFTKNSEVKVLFDRVLGSDSVTVRRKTRILHDRTYFDYPLTPVNAIIGAGLRRGVAIGSSYAFARLGNFLAPIPPANFEQWVVQHFGRELYGDFFKTYTEKVWGLPCSQIAVDWASQRIRALNLGSALRSAIFGNGATEIKSLVNEFTYPRLGAGQTYQKMADSVRRDGGRVLTQVNVRQIRRKGPRILSIVAEGLDGLHEFTADRYLTSASLTDVIQMMDPPPPGPVIKASGALRYRDHIAVNLVVKGNPFPDNWIYVHSSDVAVARIANYRNFSPDMAGNAGLSPITAEYFSWPCDGLSIASDGALTKRAIDELHYLGIIDPASVVSAFVVRSESAYPVMDLDYKKHVHIIKNWVDRFENLLPIGRTGMFKYNNQDHAIATGILGARKVMGSGHLDPWLVNIDGEYQEATAADA